MHTQYTHISRTTYIYIYIYNMLTPTPATPAAQEIFGPRSSQKTSTNKNCITPKRTSA